MLTRLFTLCLCASAFLPAALSQSSNGYNTFQSYMLTFDSAPDAALLAASRGGYTWIPEAQGRQGLAYFERTQRNYIDMRNYPDYIGRAIPQIGGEMSVEIRMMQRDFGNWQRYYAFCNTTVDAGGWPNANPSGAVVRLANPGTATSYATLTAPGLGGTGDVSITSPDTEGRIGEWNHFVVTTELRDAAAPENARGWTTIYLNGRVIVNGTTFMSGIGPRVLNWLGRSEYMLNSDAFFRGYMDNFAIYTYPMSAEAAYAHAQVNRPPVFELTFSKDPTTLANPITAPTYSWVASAGDFNKGVVALSGTSQSINLLSATGSSSVGTAVATQARTMQGAFSIEAIVSVTTLAANAPIFDAKDDGSNRIRMFTAANGAVTFSVNAATVSSSVNLVAGRFYHIVGTVSAAGGLTIYIDGQAAGTGTGSAVAAFTVTSAFLGQSTDATPVFLAGRFDAFRVYSTALTAAEITGLASTLNTVAPGTNGQVIRTAPTAPQSNPVSSFTFSKPPTAFGTMGLSTFDYVQSSVGRQGMAFFDGSKSFINLRDFPADDGSFMPTVFGGAMSFEISFQYLSSADQAMTYSLTGPRGAADNNLHLMNTFWQAGNGNINTIRSETYTERGFNGNTQLDCLGCTNGSWAHAIISIQQPNPTDFNSSNSASITMYVNGQLIASKFGKLPPTTYRPNLMLGQSGWAGDALFYGNIDSFHWYNYALAPESASVHARLPTPPVFELSFYEDARRGAGNAPGFGWQFNEPTEVHQGILVLSGGNQFADLSARSGANFVGFTIPASHGNGRNTPGVPTLQANGWAFDISFNPTSTAAGVTLVDMSATGGANGLSLAFGNNNQLVFTSGSAQLNCGIVLANVWTHIAINVVQSGQNIDGQCYKNGVRVVTSPTFPAIPYVARTIALLGKSNTVANSNFNGMIDAFRVYSYSLTSEDVQELAYIYSAAQRVIDSPAYASGPIVSHTFDVAPQLAFSDPTTAPTYNYWSYSEYGPDYAANAANRRRGVSVFNQTGNSRALRQYVDLSFDQDVYGAVIPTSIGGSLSFETWINFAPLAVLAPWQRIFDIAANDGQNNWNSNAGEYNRNLLLAIDGSNADRRLMFQHYATNGSSQPSYTIYAPVGQGVVPGTWQHIVATIETTSATAATMKLYVDGVLRASRADSLPVPYRRRPLAFLGRSNWDDPVLNATMDAFYMYNYALTEAQITRNRGLPYPPQFDASFETNPALTARSTYGWVNNDGITNHLGALTFDGNNQYVDLFSGSNVSSIGQIFPVINGLSVGGVQGFSFELSCMWKSVTGNRRVFDLSNGEGVDSFAIGSVGSNAVMYVDNGLLDENSRFGLFKITPDVYYHLIVVGKPVGPANSTTMDYQIYVKGALVATMSGKIAPTQQARRVAYIGRSSVSGEQYFQGNVDLLRYYTYPVDARIAANLTALSGTNADYVAPDADSVIWAAGSSSSSTGGVQPSTGATSQPLTSSTGPDDGNGGGNAAVRSASNIVALIATVAFAALLL